MVNLLLIITAILDLLNIYLIHIPIKYLSFPLSGLNQATCKICLKWWDVTSVITFQRTVTTRAILYWFLKAQVTWWSKVPLSVDPDNDTLNFSQVGLQISIQCSNALANLTEKSFEKQSWIRSQDSDEPKKKTPEIINCCFKIYALILKR